MFDKNDIKAANIKKARDEKENEKLSLIERNERIIKIEKHLKAFAKTAKEVKLPVRSFSLVLQGNRKVSIKGWNIDTFCYVTTRGVFYKEFHDKMTAKEMATCICDTSLFFKYDIDGDFESLLRGSSPAMEANW